MAVSFEHTVKSTSTKIREGAAKAGHTVGVTTIGGLLHYLINGETLTPGEAVAKYGENTTR